MPRGSRNTDGLNTTAMQQKHRWKGPKRAHGATLEERAARWLGDFLTAGPKPLAEIKTGFAEAGFKSYLLDKAKATVGVDSEEVDGVRVWALSKKTDSEEALTPAVDTIRESVIEQGEDEYSLTAEERKQFGIKDTEQHCWIRDPEVWKKLAPGDAARKFLHDNPGARIVYQNGQTIPNGDDLILAVLPKTLVEQRRALHHQRERELQAQIDAQEMADDSYPDTNNPADIRRRKIANTREHVALGMIGPQSPSHGMPYEDYVRYRGLTVDDIEREERSYSLRGHTNQDLDGDEAARVIAEERSKRAQEQPRGQGGKFFSIPANVRPRNLQRTGAGA